MHYTGTVWRPPYEAKSLLVEATAGCTHHKCKFCTLYDELPFSFRKSPLNDIEEDLKEAEGYYSREKKEVKRIFLTGANPFVLEYERLMDIGCLIHRYFPANESIGCFARVTDIASKSDMELMKLKEIGYDGLTIGMETGDSAALKFMNKGYTEKDIVVQCKRLERVGITYKFFYLTGISGLGNGEEGAKLTAKVCNQLHPVLVGANMLTIFQNAELFKEIQEENWKEEPELEKYRELRTLVENLSIKTEFAALGASNAIQLQGFLPQDREKMVSTLDRIIEKVSEEDLRQYRVQLPHL